MNPSYRSELTVPASPDEILAAIHDPRRWWSAGITGSARARGDEFGFLDGEDEWVGTRCTFELVPGEESTVLQFTHDGLYPHFACYDVCSQGWDHYIGISLAAVLAGGRGTPNAAHTARTDYEASIQLGE